MLHQEEHGAGPAVVLVHGFTQTLRSWDPVASTLARGHRVVTVDLPGHGGSGASRLAFEATARVLARVGPAAFVGYSMGGRLCLRVALDHPTAVSALVLLGASPGIPDPAVRRARLAEDDERARALERDGVETFVDRWLQGPLFETLPAAAAGREHRLVNRAEDLAAALRLLGAGAQEPLWDRLSELRVPTLLIAGSLDTRYVAVARDMAVAAGPGAPVETALVEGAGHAAHLERPEAFSAVVEDFLARHVHPTP